MNRNRTRISRALVGLLVFTLVAGGAVYLREAAAHKKTREQQANVLPILNTTPPPMQVVSQVTPVASAPSTQPAMPPVSMGAQLPAVAKSLVTETPKVSTVVPSTQPMLAAKSTVVTPLASGNVPPATAVPASAVIPAWSPTAAAAPSAPASDFLAVASTKVAGGDVLGARRMLNDALLSGKLSDADVQATRKQLADVNDTIIFSLRKFADDDYGGTHIVQPGERLSKIADSYDVPWELIAKINGLSDPRKMKSGAKLKIVKGPFNLVVHKKTFMMDLYLGSTPGMPGSLYVKSFPVGLGRDDSTPMGTWMVETGHKTKDPVYYSPRGEGVIAATDPKNPLGHRWIGLTGVDGQAVGQQSYGIHGTIDPDSIGKQASMGCIRMHNEDVEQVFDMLAEGKTAVIVKD